MGMWRVRGCAAVLAVCLLPVASCAPPVAPPEGAPRLLLIVVVDQFRGDYLDRFEPLWTAGIRRLLDEGVVFADAHHQHAVTHTSSGHASLVTGCHPRRHGIIANYWFDPVQERRVYSVDDPEHGVSPVNLLEPTLGDWLKQRSGRSRVFAASGKDRAAVLLGGRRADAAFWYDDETGEWRSSGYYAGAKPAWLAEFNGLRLADEQLGEAWRPLPVSPEQMDVAGIEALDLGPLRPGFPHSYGGLAVAPGESLYWGLYGKPWLDEYLTRFAERLIVEEELGSDGWTDLLALGYSALDSAGHNFGPDSPEVLDTLLRLDLLLGELLELVDRRVGLENVVVALSSDHGVAPVPELGRVAGGRLTSDLVVCFQQANRRLVERFGAGRWLLNGPFVNPEAVAAAGVDRQRVEEEAAAVLAACPGVEHVWRRGELVGDFPPAARLAANSHHPERSPDLHIEFEPFFLPTRSASTHGSQHAYDTHVPLVLRVPGLGPGRDEAPAATVDLAPTLAALTGLPAPAADGSDLGPRLEGAR